MKKLFFSMFLLCCDLFVNSQHKKCGVNAGINVNKSSGDIKE